MFIPEQNFNCHSTTGEEFHKYEYMAHWISQKHGTNFINYFGIDLPSAVRFELIQNYKMWFSFSCV